jgi:fucose 4-O-acetylase-like acetyltransferase
MNTVTNMNAAPSRTAWVDVAKGLGIILVVVGHGIGGLQASGAASPHGGMAHAYNLIYTFHMPLFFFISGLFVVRRINSGPASFATHSTTRLARSYLIWLPIQMMAISSAGNLANKALNPGLIDYVSILWTPGGHFWYIYALAILNLFSAALLPNFGSLVLLGLTLSAFSLVERFAPPQALWGVCWFGSYYALGVIFSQLPKLRAPRSLHATFAAIFLTVLWAHLYFEGNSQGIRYWTFHAYPMAIAGSTALLLWSLLPTGRAKKVLVYLGKNSLPIYLLHVMFVAGTRIFLKSVLGFNDPVITLMIIATVGIIGPILVKYACDFLKITRHLGLE